MKDSRRDGTRGLALSSDLNLKFGWTPEEIEKTCTSLQTELVSRLDLVGKVTPAQANFANTFLAMETATWEFYNQVNPVLFLKDVSADEKVRSVAGECAEKIGQLLISIYAREDLYKALKSAAEKKEELSALEIRLRDEFLSYFTRNGLNLPADQRKVFVEKKQRIVALQEAYQRRIPQGSKDFVTVSAEELDGLTPDFIERLPKTPEGKFKITLDKATSLPFLENAKNEAARKRVDEKFYLIGGQDNVRDLEEAIRLRAETAAMLGFPTHAHFVLDRQMAKSPDKVIAFLKPLVEKLKIRGKQDLAELAALKKEEHPESTDLEIHSWDWRYYANQWKIKKFQIDSQQIKEYFPLDTVLNGMFEIYQTLLGVKYVEVKNPVSWHPSVKLFQIVQDGTVIGHFYMDLFPREGKYNHFAAFDLLKGYQQKDGTYRTPVSAIVGNFTPPSATNPSLLEHDEVETMFHEFGHIMHQTLTNAPFGTFSGTSVMTDYVEAPSQMLENWVWEAAPLQKLSGHYKNPAQKLPVEIVNRMLQAKLVNVGIQYLRQASFALIDMTYHTQNSVDGKSTQIYSDIIKDTMLIPIQKGTLPQAAFGHLMGGYDSGYYGYLWSKVFAQDMYTRFANEGLLNPKTGGDYRKWILEPGGTQDPMLLIKSFLGREPNQDAFLKSLGLN